MRKKILSVFLTLALLSTTFPAGVLATEPGAEPDSGGIDLNSNSTEPSGPSEGEPSEGEPTENPPAEGEPEETPPASPSDIETVETNYQIDPEDFPFTNDELFAGYVNDLFGIVDPYGISTFSTGSNIAREDLSDTEKAAYDILLRGIQDILAGTRTSTVFDVSTLNLNADEVDIHKVVTAIMLDHPYEMFWYDKTSGYSAPSRGPQDGPMIVQNVSMAVAQSYSRTNALETYETDASKITAATKATVNAKEIIDGAASKATPYEKLLYFKQQICDLVEYNHAAADNTNTPYGDPWQMIYVFDKDPSTNVVCEGYAKAFQYLCDQTFKDGSVQCYTVSGTMRGGTGAGSHMWNIVTLEGENYLVDVTNCDGNSVGAPDKLFLVAPNSGSVSTSYTFSANGGTITYTYDRSRLPWEENILTLSDSNYSFDVTLSAINCTSQNGDIPLIGEGGLFDELGGTIDVDPDNRVFIVPTDDSREISFETTVTKNGQTLTPDCDWVFDYDFVNVDDKIVDPGLQFAHDKNKATLTITKRALINADKDIPLVIGTVSVSYGGGSARTFPIIIYRRQSEAKSIEILKDSKVITSDRLEPGTEDEVYTARVLDQYGEIMPNDSVTWDSSNKQIFTVNENGRVTVVTTEDKGDSAYLIAKCDNIKCELPITISSLEPHDLTGVRDVTLSYGSTAKITGIPTGATATYTPTNTSVVTVSNDGTITPHKVGNTTVTVTVAADATHSETSKEITVTVNKADITNITTAAPTATINANNEKNTADGLKDAITLPETVTVTYGQSGTATLPITWTANASNAYNVKGGTYTWTGVPTVGENFNATNQTLTATLTVTPVRATLTLDPSNNTIKTTDSAALVLPTATLKVTCDPADVSISDITVNTWKNGSVDFTLEALKTEASNLTADKTLTLTPVYALPDWATLDGSVPTFKLTLTSHTALTAAMVEDIPAQTYDGSAKTPAVTVKDGEKTLTAGTDYNAEYKDNTNAGTATVTIIGKGDYSGSIPKTFTISPKQLADSMIADITAQTLVDGKAEPVVVATDNQKTLVKDTDYTVEYSNNTAVGTGTVTITGKGNYTGTASKDFTITNSTTPVQKSFTVADIGEQKYTGSEIRPTVVVRDGSNGATLTEGTHYTVRYENNTAIGEAKVTITGRGDYVNAPAVTKTFQIVANAFTIANIDDQKYTGSEIKPIIVVRDGSKTLVENTDYTVTYENNTNVGTATVTITGIGAYAGKVETKTFQIIANTFTVENLGNRAYTGDPIEPKVVVKDGETVLIEGTDYEVAYSNNTIDVGTVTVTITGLGAYKGASDTKTFEITPPADPIVKITLTGTEEGDRLDVERDGDTIKVAGLGDSSKVNVSLELMKGLDQETSGNTITVKSGNTTIATYTIDKSGVTAKVKGITVEEGINPAPVVDDTKVPEGHKNEVEESAKSITAPNLLESAVKELQEIAKTIKNGDEKITDIKVETKLNIKATEYAPANKSLTLDITPVYTITVTKSEGEAEVTTENIETKHLSTLVKLEITLPTGFANSTDKIFVEHTPRDGGKMEIIRALLNGTKLSWQQKSFSTDKIVVDNRTVIVEFPNGESKTFDRASLGENLGNTYTINGKQYSTVNEDFLNDLNGKENLKATVYTKPDIPVTPVTPTPSENTGISSNGTSGTSSPALKPLPDRNQGTTTPANPTTPSNPSDEHSFTDVPANHWAAAAIDWVSTQGLMNGISDTQFAPNRQTTRQQLWMILARLNGTSPANMAEARTWAMNNGISDGTNATQNMSRQQMVTFLYRYAQQKGYQLTGSADLSSYSDNSAVAGYAREALAWAVANGIVNGTSQTTLSPTGTATRAQFATILQRFYNSIINQ